MTVDNIEKRLEIWKQFLLINIGGALVLMIVAIVELLVKFYPDRSYIYSGWYVAWFVIQVNTVTSGIALLSGRSWRQLSLSTRLNTAFGYLTTGWFVLTAFGLKADVVVKNALVILILGTGATIGLSYWWLQRRHITAPEEMFP